MHPSKNFNNVQEPTSIEIAIDNLQLHEILGIGMSNDQQDICHYFVDLEGIGASGFSDKEDDD